MDPNTTTSSLANAINLNTAHRQVIPLTLFVAVLCLCLVIGHLLNENRWVNESITAIIIGCVVGTIILCTSKWKSSQLLRFDEELFFIYLLPPIIFNAGFLIVHAGVWVYLNYCRFSVKKKQFFHNFFPIMLFGVIGVFISTSIVAAGCWWLFPKLGFKGLTISEYLSIGTIFSSTDTVCTLQVLHQDETPLLYSLVFGEGVVNDATSVVLFNAVRKITANTLGVKAALRIVLDFLYLFSTSTLLGVTIINSCTCCEATVFIYYYFNRHSSVREISLMILIAYLSYMLAELFELSGILTVFFSGVLMSHYAWHNVTESSRVTTKHAFAAMSFIAETFIFLYVGMDALDYEKWKMSILSFWTSIGIYSTVMFLILLGRAAFVFPLSLIANYLHRSDDPSSKITGQHQVTLFSWYYY
ncbi:putative cation/H+ exchanger, cation/H+ exchanger, CPA1 family [Helianthus annuus]|nr:putative cation/H+ exchanger, cation/H+ exchanger, CPA1 family [Helianthus annuus]KAJ0684739.1 putative cation/H+ exchanger, cation/H+ exchanger, CPA1 family [Helianthus annuus]